MARDEIPDGAVEAVQSALSYEIDNISARAAIQAYRQWQAAQGLVEVPMAPLQGMYKEAREIAVEQKDFKADDADVCDAYANGVKDTIAMIEAYEKERGNG
jgi:hypothetical protein